MIKSSRDLCIVLASILLTVAAFASALLPRHDVIAVWVAVACGAVLFPWGYCAVTVAHWLTFLKPIVKEWQARRADQAAWVAGLGKEARWEYTAEYGKPASPSTHAQEHSF